LNYVKLILLAINVIIFCFLFLVIEINYQNWPDVINETLMATFKELANQIEIYNLINKNNPESILKIEIFQNITRLIKKYKLDNLIINIFEDNFQYIYNYFNKDVNYNNLINHLHKVIDIIIKLNNFFNDILFDRKNIDFKISDPKNTRIKKIVDKLKTNIKVCNKNLSTFLDKNQTILNKLFGNNVCIFFKIDCYKYINLIYKI